MERYASSPARMQRHKAPGNFGKTWGDGGPLGDLGAPRRAERSPRLARPAPPTWGRSPSNDSVQRVGGSAGSSGLRSFLPGTAQPPRPREPGCSLCAGPANATWLGSGAAGGGGVSNSSGDALVTRLSTLLRDLPTLKAAVVVACAFSALLIACLLLRVFRSGKRLRKTRKYDIITTPAERVEMAPLNEEDDEDEDSTVFDIKYR
ncbi:membrane protein FAM174B [Heterocephalus glaber]|uniref:Membrane protein FAM174B n=1 Tax=Heterocephalus glaber TaxID=10181 RepID=A0AAX6PJG0_HETGA|nr:membrane protein FAM174B [Heterocephalus glaber]